MQRRGRRPLHARAVAVGARDLRAPRAGGLAAACPRCGSARTSSSAASGRAPSRVLRDARRQVRLPGREDRPGLRTRTSSCRAPAIRRLVAEGRVDEAGALLGRHYFIDGVVVAGRRAGPGARVPDGEPRDGQRAGAAARRLRHHRQDGRRDVQPAVTNIGVRPTFGGGRAASIETHLLRAAGTSTARACVCTSCSGCATSRRSSRLTPCGRRSPRTAATRAPCSGGFRFRIGCPMTETSDATGPLAFAASFPPEERFAATAAELAARLAGRVRLRGGRGRGNPGRRADGVPGGPRGGRGADGAASTSRCGPADGVFDADLACGRRGALSLLETPDAPDAEPTAPRP